MFSVSKKNGLGECFPQGFFCGSPVVDSVHMRTSHKASGIFWLCQRFFVFFAKIAFANCFFEVNTLPKTC